MMRHCLLSTLVLAAFSPLGPVGVTGVEAWAQRTSPAAPPADADPDTEIARRHFTRGTTLYDDGKYAEAIVEFEAAKKLKQSPALDYNIARCQDRREHLREAIDAYERFLAGAPGDADAPDVRARIAVLRQRLDEAERAKAPPAPREAAPTVVPAATVALPATEPSPTRPRRRLYTWIVGGAGAALLVGSIAAGLVAHGRYGDLQSSCAPDGACDAATVPNAQRWIDDGKTAGRASDVLLSVGAAAVVAGVVLYFVEGRHPAERHAWLLAPTLSTTGAGLAIGGAW